MKDTTGVFKILNEMQAAGAIGKYAIGGAVAAVFYNVEPATTYDIDVFIPFENAPGSSLASLGKQYDYLLKQGYKTSGAHILMAGWQVQFLQVGDPLMKEALEQAMQRQVGDVKTWVMKAEHLMAIALRLGRGKDFLRLEQFARFSAYNKDEFQAILTRHNLLEKWQEFSDKYLTAPK